MAVNGCCLSAGGDPRLGSASRTLGSAGNPTPRPDGGTPWSASPPTSCRPSFRSGRSSATTSELRLRSHFCSRGLEGGPELATGELL